ncbi:MAG TPA: hypothetical protein VJT16_15670 [Streptosporangiaceae bacterium]|nr:hypothetical protein [Streptosporangiaceae bacterium]
MSGGSTASRSITARMGSTADMVNTGDTSQKWAALAKQNERLVDASHPLLAELRRDHPETGRRLPAAS